jgi:hypothetical protein
MVVKYGITIHDYKSKQTRIIEWFNSRYNALSKLEELAYSYIYDKEGIQDIKIYDKNSHGKPYSHYLFRDSSKYLDKLIIKKKIKITGYLYNGSRYENIISYYLTEFDDGTQYLYNLIDRPVNTYKDLCFLEVLKEIKEFKKPGNIKNAI